MSESTLDTLQQLLVLVCRSFPRYLVYARPWTRYGQEQLQDSLTQIATDQQSVADRLSDAIFEFGGTPRSGDFPMDFTDTHDLSMSYILQLAAEYQKQDIEALEQCSRELRFVPAAGSLAQEALGLAKGHLKLLESLQNPARN